jgi:putative glutamine amidotransferase
MKRAALTYRDETRLAPYANALRSAGIEPVLVTPETPLASLEGMGLLLTGGTDLDPALYGAAPRPETETPDRERDAMEQRLLRKALERDIAVLAICRGMQLFNATHPHGTLVQHIDGHRTPQTPHPIAIEAGTRLAKIFGVGARPVNSRHHQSVGTAGHGLVISARAADGVIEALERSDRRFAVAVQWHPEDRPEDRALFEAFREAL